jgi:hypothetical protein
MNAEWPNDSTWSALRDGARVTVGGETYALSVVDCGQLYLPTGRVAACDPFVQLDDPKVFAQVPPGRYAVRVTLADVSGALDGSHVREAYVSLLLHPGAQEASRRPLGTPEGEDLAPGEFYGFGVDAGTACFVDAGAAARCMPEGSNWYESLFDHAGEDAWFKQMDDPDHIRHGIANITLPLAREGENVIIVHSGWGDGVYPVVGGYDVDGRLVAVHIDFGVVHETIEGDDPLDDEE